MKKALTELEPRWVGSGGEGVTDKDGNSVPWREGVGVSCNCPCGCDRRLFVAFANPLSGGPALSGHQWQRTGDTFETLTLTPSIQRADPNGCRWHGFVTNGEIINA